jgi:hypothetical protein
MKSNKNCGAYFDCKIEIGSKPPISAKFNHDIPSIDHQQLQCWIMNISGKNNFRRTNGGMQKETRSTST